MGQGGRLALAKGFAARLIEEVSRAGDDIALLIFGGRGVELLIPPGPARSSAIMRVRQCGGGGGTFVFISYRTSMEHGARLECHVPF